jgi:pilus assembly protein CpaF
MALSERNKKVVATAKELFDYLINDYARLKNNILGNAKNGLLSEDDFREDVSEHIDGYYSCSEEVKKEAIKLIVDYIYGYATLTPLINDDSISDIRCVSYDNIRIKRKGKRMNSDIKFESQKEYTDFCNYVTTRNHVNASNRNAIQKFTDTTTDKDTILRFTLSQPLVNTNPWPTLTIRKVPRNFPELDDLVKEEMLSDELKNELIERFRTGSTIICGGNSSGKTTILNALKETLPHDMAVLIAQQADELTTKTHPDITFMHSLPGNFESDVSYDLKDISIAGLTMDIDFFIIGEVKGGEAKYLLNAAYTGQLCACTVHAPSAPKAIDKIIDYALSEGGYSKDELMKMMDCFNTIIFMKDYKVNQVIGVNGYNRETGDLDYYTIFENGKFIDQTKAS